MGIDKDISRSYDLAVAGAGPAGLMAAKTAREGGLRVVVLEKRKDISRIRRACCAHLVMDLGYEGEAIQVGGGLLRFPSNRFELPYGGPLIEIRNKYFFSPEGHRIRFARPDSGPIGIKFDKGRLLGELADACAALGVELMLGAVVRSASDRPGGVRVEATRGDERLSVEARKLVAADGVNARIAGSLGMNEERGPFHVAFAEKYVLEEVRGFEPGSWNFHFGRAFGSHYPVLVGPSFLGEGAVELTAMGSRNLPPGAVFKAFVTRSPVAERFARARVLDRHGATLRTYRSLKTPYRGNVLVAGDAAAYIEVENQGALMCGFRAGEAVVRELKGEPGFADYAEWWRRSFEFNSDEYLKVAQGYALVPTYEDGEIDYLFSLVEGERLEGTFSQYRTPVVMWGAVLRHGDRIARERPGLHQKLSRIREMSFAATQG